MYRISNFLLLFLIIILGVFLRFYKLQQYPIQLNHDEVSQIYDAISIAQTGKDIYGNFMPIIFHSVGDFKSPFYTYITSLFYFIFGGGELTIKLPGAIFGSLIIYAVYLFVINLIQNKKIALLAAFFTAVAPFEIFFSRKSFENVAGIFLMLIGFSFLLIFIRQSKAGKKWLYFSAVAFVSAIYTYYSHAIILPVLILSFAALFRNQVLSRWKEYVGPALLFVVFYLPILIMTLINPDLSYRSKTVFITQDPRLGALISQSAVNNPIVGKFMEIKIITDYVFSRYLQQFDLSYIFGQGLELTNQGLLGMGLLFFIELPLVLFGIFYLIKQNNLIRENKFIFAWITIGMLPSGLTFEDFSPHRVIMVFTMLNIIAASGLYWFIKVIYGLKKEYAKILLSILSLCFLLNIVYFLHIYFVNFPYEKSQNIQYPFKQVSLFAWENYDKVDSIIFDSTFGEHAPIVGTGVHYYLAYYGNYPPERFQKEYRFGSKPREVLFGKFSIRKVDWREDRDLKNVLIIASNWVLPIDNIDKNKIIKVFYFYDGKPAFYAIKL